MLSFSPNAKKIKRTFLIRISFNQNLETDSKIETSKPDLLKSSLTSLSLSLSLSPLLSSLSPLSPLSPSLSPLSSLSPLLSSLSSPFSVMYFFLKNDFN